MLTPALHFEKCPKMEWSNGKFDCIIRFVASNSVKSTIKFWILIKWKSRATRIFYIPRRFLKDSSFGSYKDLLLRSKFWSRHWDPCEILRRMSIDLAAFWLWQISASKESGRYPQDSQKLSPTRNLKIRCSKGESDLAISFLTKIWEKWLWTW